MNHKRKKIEVKQETEKYSVFNVILKAFASFGEQGKPVRMEDCNEKQQ